MDATDSEESWLAYQQRLMRDPKYREARRAQDRSRYAQRRANLVRVLGFTPEMADAAIDLQIDEDFFLQEMRTNRNPTSDELDAARVRNENFQREQQQKLRSLLGEEKLVRLQGYMESRESRMQVEDLRLMLGEGNALRDDQIEPLISALHVERSQAQAALREFRDSMNWDGDSNESQRLWGERKVELTRAMNARMLASASSSLTQPQLKALDDQLKEELARTEADVRLNRIQAKLNAPRTTEN